MLFLRKWAAIARVQLLELARGARARLIDDLKRASHFWSLRLGALALLLQSVLVTTPDVALQAWNGLPDEIKALLPVHYVNLIAAVLTAAGLVARVVKQPAPTNG